MRTRFTLQAIVLCCRPTLIVVLMLLVVNLQAQNTNDDPIPLILGTQWIGRDSSQAGVFYDTLRLSSIEIAGRTTGYQILGTRPRPDGLDHSEVLRFESGSVMFFGCPETEAVRRRTPYLRRNDTLLKLGGRERLTGERVVRVVWGYNAHFSIAAIDSVITVPAGTFSTVVVDYILKSVGPLPFDVQIPKSFLREWRRTYWAHGVGSVKAEGIDAEGLPRVWELVSMSVPAPDEHTVMPEPSKNPR